MRLALKMFAGAAGVVIATVGGALALTSRSAGRAADAAVGRAVSATADQAAAYLGGSGRGLLDGAGVFAQNASFRSLVTASLQDDLLDQSREAVDRLGATWVQITDGRGVRLARSDAPGAPPAALDRSALIREALAGRRTVAYGLMGDSVLFQAAAVPVEGAVPGEVAGVLMVARSLDDQLARSLRASTGSEVMMYGFDATGTPRVLASSLPRGRALSAAVAELAARMRDSGGGRERPAAAGRTLTLGGERFVGRALPLRSASAQVLGGVVVLRSRDAELAGFADLRRTMLLAGAGGIGLALAVSYILARLITRPLGALALAARRAARGEYATEIPVLSRDEVGTLADAVRAMLADLREKQVLVEFMRVTDRRQTHPPALLRAPAHDETAEAGVPAIAATALAARDAANRPTIPFRSAGRRTPAPAGAPGPRAPRGVTPPDVAAIALGPGELFGGRYLIHHMLGAGGVGVVFRATDQQTGATIALKVLRPDLVAAEPQLVERLRSELRLAQRITHPNVVRTFETGEAAGLHFITMEYVEATPLSGLIAERGRLPVRVAVSVGMQLCHGLGAAHGEGVIHRDVKPDNLLVAPDGRLKVTDFGIARLTERAGNFTATGVLMGTPAYMAPELLRGRPVDPRVDVYAAGVVLYECLTGVSPFGGGPPSAVLTQVLEATPTPPHALDRSIPAPLSSAVMRAMARDPEDRLQTADELYALIADLTA